MSSSAQTTTPTWPDQDAYLAECDNISTSRHGVAATSLLDDTDSAIAIIQQAFSNDESPDDAVHKLVEQRVFLNRGYKCKISIKGDYTNAMALRKFFLAKGFFFADKEGYLRLNEEIPTIFTGYYLNPNGTIELLVDEPAFDECSAIEIKSDTAYRLYFSVPPAALAANETIFKGYHANAALLSKARSLNPKKLTARQIELLNELVGGV